MGTTTVDIPEALENGIERELERGKYASKSELIRAAIRAFLEQEDMIVERTLSEKAKARIEEAREQDDSVSHREVFS